MQPYRTTLAQHLGIQAKSRDQILPRRWRFFHHRLIDFLSLWVPNTHRWHTMTKRKRVNEREEPFSFQKKLSCRKSR